MLNLIVGIERWIFQLFIVSLIGRFVIDLYRAARPGWKPQGMWLWICEIAYTLSEWILKPVRKVIKPIRLGSLGFDVSWTVATVLLYLLEGIVTSVIYAIFSPVR